MKARHFPAIVGLLLLVGCQPDTTRSSPPPSSVNIAAITPEQLLGIWRVVSIGDQPVAENSPARLQLPEDGAINGNASCNRFFGNYTYNGQHLIIKNPLGATKMLCLPALMEQEAQLLRTLNGVLSVGLEQGHLVLRDPLGNVILEALPEKD
jgi:heat shock protein HslJ